MIKLFDTEIALGEILNREIQTYGEYEGIVKEILERVIAEGDEAVLAYTRRFDCPTLESLKVTEEEIDAAMARISPDFLETLRQAIQNITAYHRNQLQVFSCEFNPFSKLQRRYSNAPVSQRNYSPAAP